MDCAERATAPGSDMPKKEDGVGTSVYTAISNLLVLPTRLLRSAPRFNPLAMLAPVRAPESSPLLEVRCNLCQVPPR